MKDSIKAKGVVYVDIKKPDGTVVSTVIENLVVNAGKEFFTKKIFNDSFEGRITKIGIGAKKDTQQLDDTLTKFNTVTAPTPSPIIKDIDFASSAIETNSSPLACANTIAYITTFFDTTGDTLRDSGGTPVTMQEIALIGTDGNSPESDIVICRTTFDDDSPMVGFTKLVEDVVTVTWKLTFN